MLIFHENDVSEEMEDIYEEGGFPLCLPKHGFYLKMEKSMGIVNAPQFNRKQHPKTLSATCCAYIILSAYEIRL